MEWYNFPDEMNLPNYEIRKNGIIRNKKTKYELTHTKKDYLYIKLSNNGTCKSYAVHILVAKVFLENPENKLTVDHIDRNTFNCKLDNLRWATHSEQNKNQTRYKNISGKKIKQYDLKGNLIKVWNNSSEAAKILNVKKSRIIDSCRGKQLSTAGFIWKYFDNTINNKKINIQKITILQYDKNILINEWGSAKEAGNVLNIDPSSIIKCCKGKNKTSGNFIWKYNISNKEIYVDENIHSKNIKKTHELIKDLWKKIIYKEKDYYVSKIGDVASIFGYIYKKSIKNEYYFFKSTRVHRLVAKAFIPNPLNLPIVNHKDGNKLNNNVENLEWCTQKDNMIHFNKNNLIKKDNRQKKVYEYDNENNLINTFNSIAEASKTYNLTNGIVRNQCKSNLQKRFRFT